MNTETLNNYKSDINSITLERREIDQLFDIVNAIKGIDVEDYDHAISILENKIADILNVHITENGSKALGKVTEEKMRFYQILYLIIRSNKNEYIEFKKYIKEKNE